MADNWNDSISSLLDRILEAEGREHAFKEQEADLKRQKLEAQRDVKDAKGELQAMLTEAGVTTENHPRATITLAAGRVTLKAAKDADPEALPIDLLRIKKEPDKAAIQAALVRGDKVDGFELSQGAPSLKIKLKETANAA